MRVRAMTRSAIAHVRPARPGCSGSRPRLPSDRPPAADRIRIVTLKSDTRAEGARIADLEAALAREMRISAALREVGLALGTTLDLDQLLELILGKITEALDADRATLYLLDEARGE